MKIPAFYWFRFGGEGFPVTMPAMSRTKHFRWRGLYGVQIGRWFIGAINGDPGTEHAPAPLPGEAIRTGAEQPEGEG